MHTFSLQEFNDTQREVVAHDQGPMLVVSGAGTGKTKVLIGRMRYLMEEKNVTPDAILALTFTEKAAEEMQIRLDEVLPLGHSEIWIKTFHAFAERALRERGVEIGLPIDFTLMKEVDMWMFLREHVTDFEFEYYRPFSNPERLLMTLQGYFSRLQDEDITPDHYLEWVARIKKTAKTDEEKENVLKHGELARAYETYTRLLVENNKLDFGGLLYYTLRLFEKRKSVLKEYQDRFRHILVDEFQDTNFAQNKIVTLLAQPNHNLTVVGDDDQSIYKWRGASLTNISYFQRLFPKARTVVLNENYRSTQEILDLAYAVIQKNNPHRLEVSESVSKRLIATSKSFGSMPKVHHFPTLDEEVQFTVKEAIAALKKGHDTALLVRTNALARPFIERLMRARVPFQHSAPADFFNKPGVKDCIALLRIVANPWDDVALFRFLTLPVWKIPMQRVLAALRKARMAGHGSFFDALNDEQFVFIKKILSELIELARAKPVSKLLSYFLTASGYLKAYAEQDDERITDIALLSSKVAEFERTSAHTAVADFLRYVQLIEEVGEGRTEASFLDPHAIKILTIHGAKGLEFDTVFVPGLVQWKFPTVARKDPFEVPAELLPEALPETVLHIAEERRLFYVACTRARTELTLSYSDFYEGKKQWKPSCFIIEALESGKARAADSKNKKNKAHHAQSSLSLEKERPHPLGAARPHRPLALKLPRLSFSQLDTFRTCPLKYQFRYLFNIPAPIPAVANFGSSIHATLKNFYEFIQADPARAKINLLPELKKLYEKNWIPYGYETRSLHDLHKKRGLTMISRFYKHEAKHLAPPAFLEKAFTLELGEVTVAGRIDRIDRRGDGTYEVIDYKTGENRKKDLSKDMQLSLYALACKEVLKIPVSRLSLYFLDSLEKVSTTRSDEQLKAFKTEIIDAARELAASDFSPTPGYHCSYCDYRLICPVAAPVVR